MTLLLGVACGGAQSEQAEPLTADPPQGAVENADRNASKTDLSRGIAYIKSEKFADAKPHLEKALEKNPKNAEAAYYLAVAKEKTGDRPGAEQDYKRALAIDPKFAEASENLAALYLDDPARPDQAIALLKEALQKSPDSARLLQNLAYAYGLKKDYDGAGKYYEAAIAKGGESAIIRFAYGSLLVEAKQPDKASVQLKKALEGAGDDPAMLATIGRMLAYTKDFGDCVRAFDRAIKLKSDEAELFVRRGTCRHELKDEAGAKGDYEAAIKANKDYAAAHYYLGLSMLADKKKANALTELEQAAKLGEGTPIGKAAQEKLSSLKANKK
jgi:Flp pilus assembly protein TadD